MVSILVPPDSDHVSISNTSAPELPVIISAPAAPYKVSSPAPPVAVNLVVKAELSATPALA